MILLLKGSLVDDWSRRSSASRTPMPLSPRHYRQPLRSTRLLSCRLWVIDNMHWTEQLWCSITQAIRLQKFKNKINNNNNNCTHLPLVMKQCNDDDENNIVIGSFGEPLIVTRHLPFFNFWQLAVPQLLLAYELWELEQRSLRGSCYAGYILSIKQWSDVCLPEYCLCHNPFGKPWKELVLR